MSINSMSSAGELIFLAPEEQFAEPKIVSAKQAAIGLQALAIDSSVDIAVWEREFTPETQTAIDRYLHFLTSQPSSPLPKIESTGSAMSLALEIIASLEAATPEHLKDDMRIIARDILGRLCDYAENSSSNGLAMRFEFRRDALPEALPGIVCTNYSLSALVSSQVAADKAAYFADNFASKQVRQFNPSWVGTTTASRDLGAYMSLGDIPHILLVIGSSHANDMRGRNDTLDTNLIRSLGPDLSQVQEAVQAASASFAENGDITAGENISALLENLAELQKLGDMAASGDDLTVQVSDIQSLLEDIATLKAGLTASGVDYDTLFAAVQNSLDHIVTQFGQSDFADLLKEFAILEPAKTGLESAIEAVEAALAELLASDDLSEADITEIKKLQDMLSLHIAGEPLSASVVAQLSNIGKIQEGGSKQLDRALKNLALTQASYSALHANMDVADVRRIAATTDQLHSLQIALSALQSHSNAALTPVQLEQVRLIEPQIANSLNQLQTAPASVATLNVLNILQDSIDSGQKLVPVTLVGQLEKIAQDTASISVALHIKTAEINDTNVQTIVRSVATLKSLETLQTALQGNKLASPQQAALSAQLSHAIDALKTAPASAETLKSLAVLTTKIADTPPDTNHMPPGAQAALPSVLAGVAALNGKTAEVQIPKAEQLRTADYSAPSASYEQHASPVVFAAATSTLATSTLATSNAAVSSAACPTGAKDCACADPFNKAAGETGTVTPIASYDPTARHKEIEAEINLVKAPAKHICSEFCEHAAGKPEQVAEKKQVLTAEETTSIIASSTASVDALLDIANKVEQAQEPPKIMTTPDRDCGNCDGTKGCCDIFNGEAGQKIRDKILADQEQLIKDHIANGVAHGNDNDGKDKDKDKKQRAAEDSDKSKKRDRTFAI